MKKRFAIAVVVALVLALAVPAVFAAVNTPQQLSASQQQELKGLYTQMYDLEKQMIQKRVEFGWITKQQGDWMIQNLEARKEYLQKNGFDGAYGPGYGPGAGPGIGCPGHGGFGPGYGPGPGYGRGMMGGWGW
ncbi:MAG: YckD family protein [Firmicutes bacterium]|nr:YckD family protein [Bacillota bacterium]